MTSIIGQRLGQYEILSQIGKGGMATVYRAHQATFNRNVAIKVIKNELSEEAEFVARFRREAQFIATLAHPHILKVFDYGQEHNIVYLVMELVTGGNLATLISRSPLPLTFIARLLDQVGEALDYAHELGIIHRDMKPQNILLDAHQNAFLTDFGIAKLVGEHTHLTQSGTVLGTPAYMAPEQWYARRVDARTDIYGLGVILYEMLTGHVPFESDTPARLMYLHLQAPPPSPRLSQPNISLAMEHVVRVALAKNPEERFASGKQLANAFREAMAGVVSNDVAGLLALRPTPVTPIAAPPVPPPVPQSDSQLDSQPNAVSVAIVPSPQKAQNVSLLLLLGSVAIVLAIAALIMVYGASQRQIEANASNLSATVPISVQPTTAPPEVAANVLELFPTRTPEPSTPTPTPTPTPNLEQRAYLTLTERALKTSEAQTVESIIISTDTALNKTGTAVAVSLFTKTYTPTPTLTPSNTPAPTFTRTPTSTFTASLTPSQTALPTLTYTLTYTPTQTPTLTMTFTPRPSATWTFSPTQPYQVTALALLSTSTPLPTIAPNSVDGLRTIAVLKGHQGAVNDAKFGINLLASASDDTTIRVWNPMAYQVLYTLAGHSGSIRALAMSADGQRLASVSDDQTIRLWDLKNGNKVTVLRGHTGPVLAIAFSPDGASLASAGTDKVIILWDTEKAIQRTWLEGHFGRINSLAFSPDSANLASASSDQSVRLWDVRKGAVIGVLNGHKGDVQGVAFSPDGKVLASAGEDRVVLLWDVASKQNIGSLIGHTDTITCVEFSPSGNILVTGSRDKTIKLWSPSSQQLLRTLQGHTDTVTSVTFNREGTVIASAGLDQDVRLWASNYVTAPTRKATSVKTPTSTNAASVAPQKTDSPGGGRSTPVPPTSVLPTQVPPTSVPPTKQPPVDTAPAPTNTRVAIGTAVRPTPTPTPDSSTNKK